MILSTPGSAPLGSPRPALSMIGQLRSPSLYFDTSSTIGSDKLLILNTLYAVSGIEARHATFLHVIESSFDTPSTWETSCFLSLCLKNGERGILIDKMQSVGVKK